VDNEEDAADVPTLPPLQKKKKRRERFDSGLPPVDDVLDPPSNGDNK